ncbi:MAG: Ig-like domain-containing protein [Actinobacteria bacterium]|nr:Ig-like domain-containing protein [Actinomycetota bacterium]
MMLFSLSLLILTAILCIIILLSYLMFKNSNPLLTSISVIPENSEVEINKKQQFRVIAKYSDITTSDITRFVKWSSTDDSILTIGKSGICTALKEGCAEVCARYCKVTAKALVKVKDFKLKR